MSPEDREAITRSIANLWTFNAIVISRLVRTLRQHAVPADELARMLEEMDAAVDVLDGEDDRAFATGLLSTVQHALREP